MHPLIPENIRKALDRFLLYTEDDIKILQYADLMDFGGNLVNIDQILYGTPEGIARQIDMCPYSDIVVIYFLKVYMGIPKLYQIPIVLLRRNEKC